MAILKDRYEIDLSSVPLGLGATARVYSCYDKLLERQVSAKVVSMEHGYLLEAILREFKLVGKLRHQNVIGYYDLVEIESSNHGNAKEENVRQMAIIMDFANYGTLEDLIYKRRMQTRQFAEILRGILEGLKHIHDHGIIHRDLKPSNIIIHKDHISGTLTPIISDFLASQHLEGNILSPELTEVDPGKTMAYGTIEYMAPERYDDLSVIGSMTDLWSVGVITYEYFKRQLPFSSRQNNSPIEIAKRMMEEEIIIEGIPGPFDQIVKLCLEKDISTRVSDAGVLLNLLTRTEIESLQEAPSRSDLEEAIQRVELRTMAIEDKFVKEVQSLKNVIKGLEQEKAKGAIPDKEHLLELITENKIETCFEKLGMIKSILDREERKSLIGLESQWNDVKHKERLGMLAIEDAFILYNKIRNHLLSFIEELRRI